MSKKQIKTKSLTKLPPISNQSKLFQTKQEYDTTSKIFIDRFMTKRESSDAIDDEGNEKRNIPRALIQLPKKSNSSGFTSFWEINQMQTSELLTSMKKMKSKSSFLQPSVRAQILSNQKQFEKIRANQQNFMKEQKLKLLQRIKQMTPFKMKKQVKIRQKFKNKTKLVKNILLSMTFKIYEENRQAWKPYFDYDSLPIAIGNQIFFIGGRKHCNIVSFNIKQSKWKQIAPIEKLKPFGECPVTIVSDSKVMCFGGYNYFQQGFSLINNTLKIIDLKNMTVEFRQFSQKKTPERAFHSQCIYGEFLIISGGTNKNSQLFNNFMNYNFVKNYWSELTVQKMPNQLQKGFSKHQTISIFHTRKNYSIYNDEIIVEMDPDIKEEGIYIFGGEDSEANLISNMYLMKLGSPSVVISSLKIDGKPPIGRRNTRMIRHKNYLIVHGGRNDEMNPFVLCSMHFFNLSTFNWIQVTGEKPPYRYSHSLSIMNGDIIIMGGKSVEGLCKEVYVMSYEEVIQYV